MEDLQSRRFSRAEVMEMLRKEQFEYEMSLSDQKQRIFELVEEVKRLEEESYTYKSKEKAVSLALVTAIEKAKEIEELAKKKYHANLSKLIIFENKFVKYYECITKKYPLDDNLMKLGDFLKKMDEVLSIDNIRRKKSENIFMGINGPRNDLSTSESGFDFNEALNPSKELEEICRELGLMN